MNKKLKLNLTPDEQKWMKEEKLKREKPFQAPPSDETGLEYFKFKGHKRVAILSDIHVPYHSIQALTAAVEFVKKEKPDAILLNGDLLDCHKISRYQTDPRKKDFATELSIMKMLLDELKRVLKCKIYYKLGNHDIRYENYLIEKAGELAGVKEFQFENIIKARAEGITIIGDKTIMKLNRLRGIHGHEYRGGITAPVSVSRGLFLKGKVSAFQGHNHRSDEYSEANMDDKLVTTFSIGCLSELHPAYMPLNKWNHGFAIVDLDQNGDDFLFRNFKVYGTKIF